MRWRAQPRSIPSPSVTQEAVDGALTLARNEVLFGVFVIPMTATIVMGFLEGVAAHSAIDWRERFLRTGWDLCVLALGSTGAVFSLSQVQQSLGTTWALFLAVMSILVTIFLGVMIALIRRHSVPVISGWLALLAVGLGGTTLTLPWYFVMRSFR